MDKVLVQASKLLDIRLAADSDLARQRLTVFCGDIDARQFRAAVEGLLGVDNSNAVKWVGSDKGGWVLHDSLNRRRLSARLRDKDLEIFLSQLETDRKWLADSANGELQQATERQSAVLPVIKTRIALVSLITQLSQDQLRTFTAGKPLAVKVGQMSPMLRAKFHDYLRSGRGSLKNAPDEHLDSLAFAYVVSRSPTNSLGARVIESRIDPQRGVLARHSTVLRVPHVIRIPALEGVFQLPPPDPKNESQKVTFNLSPEAEARPGQLTLRSFDQVLEVVAAGAGLNIVADGYLRGSTRFPANFQVEKYPLSQLLDRICEVWSCNWRYSGSDKKTILIRAREWWMEDAADVPDAELNHLRKAFGSGMIPELADLQRFAELSNAQAHKLLESGVCPGAYGLVRPLWYDALGAKPCLQTLSHLTAQQRVRVTSPEGLSLAEIAPEIVNRTLADTLIAEVGVLDAEAVRSLVFRILPIPERGPRIGYRVELFRPDLLGPRWSAEIKPLRVPPSPQR